MTDLIDLKPGDFSFIDPKTIKPHPVSAALYDSGEDNGSIQGCILTPLEASNEVFQKMDVADILKSIKRDGIIVPLVVNTEGIIISGCRRWKVAMKLGLTSVPVEIRSYQNETEETQAILDYNRYREKTFSQKMREAELMKEINGARAKKKMLAGRNDPTLMLEEGHSIKRSNRETAAIVGSSIHMGKDTYRKGEQIWNRSKQGDQKAMELTRKLDEKATSVNAAYNTLKKADESFDRQGLSRWQSAEPIDSGDVWICPICGPHRVFHLKNGKHRLMETVESPNSVAPTSDRPEDL
jgi:ParB-like chromosome segregation protein Spo0J